MKAEEDKKLKAKEAYEKAVAEAKLAEIERAKFRLWRSTNGKLSVNAKIVKYADGFVTVQDHEGKQTKLVVKRVRMKVAR